MSGVTIFLLVMLVGAAIAIPLAIRATRLHQDRLRLLRAEYSAAAQSGHSPQIISAARELIDEFKTSNQAGLSQAADSIYRDILGMLARSPELKAFALEVGRIAYGSKRKERVPTIYDEQAIANDISAHT